MIVDAPPHAAKLIALLGNKSDSEIGAEFRMRRRDVWQLRRWLRIPACPLAKGGRPTKGNWALVDWTREHPDDVARRFRCTVQQAYRMRRLAGHGSRRRRPDLRPLPLLYPETVSERAERIKRENLAALQAELVAI